MDFAGKATVMAGYVAGASSLTKAKSKEKGHLLSKRFAGIALRT